MAVPTLLKRREYRWLGCSAPCSRSSLSSNALHGSAPLVWKQENSLCQGVLPSILTHRLWHRGVKLFAPEDSTFTFFTRPKVIRQTGSAHVPCYDSFHSQGFRPLFPSKYCLHSPSHPRWHTPPHTATATLLQSPLTLPLTRRESLNV